MMKSKKVLPVADRDNKVAILTSAIKALTIAEAEVKRLTNMVNRQNRIIEKLKSELNDK